MCIGTFSYGPKLIVNKRNIQIKYKKELKIPQKLDALIHNGNLVNWFSLKIIYFLQSLLMKSKLFLLIENA